MDKCVIIYATTLTNIANINKVQNSYSDIEFWTNARTVLIA